MTSWAEQSNISVQYDIEQREATKWDNGATLWDLEGNVELTDWDLPAATSYTEQTNNNNAWVEQ